MVLLQCSVCQAPRLPLGAGCVFCRSPLAGGPDPAGLLDYLAVRLPNARAARRGILRRGRVHRLAARYGGQSFTGRVRRDNLDLSPGLPVEIWVDTLLTALSRDARTDHEAREAMTRAGWDPR